MRGVIEFVLGNFTLTFFVLGLIASAIALWHARQPRSDAVIVEALFSYFLLFSIAIANFYNFVLHVFFGKMTAAFIGWEDSPFQLEVGFASLGFAAIGLLAFKGSFDMRLAAVAGPACFLWGAAAGHVYQMIAAHNFAPGNAGSFFTVTSWSRSSVSYFCGCNAARRLPPKAGLWSSDGKSRSADCIRNGGVIRTKREQTSATSPVPCAVEKHDRTGSDGDLSAQLGLG